MPYLAFTRQCDKRLGLSKADIESASGPQRKALGALSYSELAGIEVGAGTLHVGAGGASPKEGLASEEVSYRFDRSGLAKGQAMLRVMEPTEIRIRRGAFHADSVGVQE
jgi:hypothetical protein